MEGEGEVEVEAGRRITLICTDVQVRQEAPLKDDSQNIEV